jgi:hypothetical protein
MAVVTRSPSAALAAADCAEEKRAALHYIGEAWAAAVRQGIDSDCLAQVCLFTALAELVSTYGEEAAAAYAEGLAPRIRNGAFSLPRSRQ